MRRFLSRLVSVGRVLLSLLDGEFLLRWMPNSGGVVVARSAWLATVLLLAYIGVVARLQPENTWEFCGRCFRTQLADNLKLGGGIFAAAYVALYARFASQWTYLAGVYNQIMAAQLREGVATDGIRAEKLALWKAGFVEDAVAVHLAEKPMYAAVIVNMLADARVRSAYVDSTVDGLDGVARLETRLNEVLGTATVARLTARASQNQEPDALTQRIVTAQANNG